MKKKGEKVRGGSKFTEEKMRRAVLRVVEGGVSIGCVSEEVGLCKKTLKGYVDRYLNATSDQRQEFIFRPNYEINQVFTHELEKIFENHLLDVNNGVQRISRQYIRKAAFEFALTCNVHVPKTWNIRKQAGCDWMYGFFGRHPQIKYTVLANQKSKAAKNEPAFVDFRSDEKYIEETVEEIVFVDDAVVEGVNVAKSAHHDSISAPGTHYDRADADDFVISSLNSNKCVQSSPSKAEYDLDTEYFNDCAKSTSPRMAESVDDAVYERGHPETPDFIYHNEDKLVTAIRVKTPLDEFEENLREAYCAISLDGHVPSERVFNLDEIALVVENGDQRKIVVTACCCICATGHSLPPFMIFPRCTFTQSMLDGYVAGVCGIASPGGVVDDRIFLDVLQHFRDLTRCSHGNKAALIVDDDDCHVTVDSIDYCAANGIELVTLPPHSAGKLRPIGRHAYKILRSCFSNAYLKFRAKNADQNVSVRDVSALFNAIYPYAFTEEHVIRGFGETGLYPLDEKIFAQVDAMATKLVHDEDDSPVEPVEVDLELVPSGVRSSDVSESEDEVRSENAEEAQRAQETQLDYDDEGAAETEAIAHPPAGFRVLPKEKFASAGKYGIPPLVTEYDLNLAENFARTVLEEYRDGLLFAFDELKHGGSLRPDRIFNMDEIELVVRACDDRDSGLRLVSCCAVSASGTSVPPYFVYPNNSSGERWPSGVAIEGAGSRAIDEFDRESDIFVATLEHFVGHVSPTPQNRVLLIVDGEHGHVSVRSMDFCRKNGIVLMTVPSTASGACAPLQPLEKTLFKRLTSNFAAECNHFVGSAPEGRRLTMADMLAIFKNVYEDTFCADAIRDSFEDAGIWPLNRTKIVESAISS